MAILNGKYALITGAANAFGMAITQMLIDFGVSNITIVARTTEDIKAKTQYYRQKGKEIHGICADLSLPNAAQGIFSEYQERLPEKPVDILVNGAGMTFNKNEGKIDDKAYSESIQMNLGGMFQMCEKFYPLLKKSKKGASVINIASIHGHEAIPNQKFDHVKGAIQNATIALAKKLALEWEKDNIRVNCIAPKLAYYDKELGLHPKRIPLKRMIATPEEIASAVSFLAMDLASGFTGKHFVFDDERLLH